MNDTRPATRAEHDRELVGAVFDASPIGVAMWSVDGELLHANAVFSELVGRNVEDLRGELFESFIKPEDAESLVGKIADLWAGRRNYLECDIRCLDPEGRTLWLRAFLAAVYGSSGEPEYLLSQVFNFAGRGTKDVRIRQLANESPVMLWLTDRAGRPRLGNKQCFDFIGVHNPDGDLGRVWADAIHPGDLDAAAPEIRRAVAVQEPFEFIARSRRRDGTWRWIEHRARPITDENGVFGGYAGASLDVTEAERTRRKLAESEQLFESVSEAGPVAVVRTDTEGRVTYLNGRWADIVQDHERRLEEWGWHDVLHPADLERVLALGQESIRTGAPFTLRVRAIDHAVLTTAGPGGEGRREFWGELRAAPVFDADGRHTGFAATLIDVSAEVEAAAKADRLARVLDTSHDYVFIADSTGALSYANGAASETMGVVLAPGDSAGSFLWDVLDRDSVELYYEGVEPRLQADGAWGGELTLWARDGHPIPVSAQFMTVTDREGRVESISLVARDIADIKRAQQQLRELATHDRLTGLANRALLYDRLDQALARNQRLGHGVALMYCDLDEFKPVNDRLGHDAGDAVLVAIADRIRRVVRDTDTAARVGGDEFVVLVEGVKNGDLLETVATRLIESIHRPIGLDAGSVQVGVSIGLVTADEHCDTADKLMNLADRAMYRAKASGRGRLEVIPPGRSA